MLVQTNYLSLDDEEAISYEVGPRRFCYTSVRKAAEKCRLDVETFLVKVLRGQLRDYWIDDCSIEEYAISRYPTPLERAVKGVRWLPPKIKKGVLHALRFSFSS